MCGPLLSRAATAVPDRDLDERTAEMRFNIDSVKTMQDRYLLVVASLSQ